MKIKYVPLYILLFALVGLLVFCPKVSMEAAENAIYICGKTVIPSLFPFFVLSAFMVHTGFVNAIGTVLEPLARRIFRVSGSGAVVFVMGILCGYPTGAKMTAELYKNKQISKNEAVRLLPFCNNSGPLFVVGAVGTGMLGNTAKGIVLYVIHIFSAILTGIVFSFFSNENDSSSKKELFINTSVGRAFSDAVSGSVRTMLEVCGYIIFFAVVKSFLLPAILLIFGTNLYGLFISALGEVTMGAVEICNRGLPFYSTMILLSGVIGFGGICVFLQVLGVAGQAGLPVRTYVIGKLFQSALSMLITTMYLKHYEISSTFLSVSDLTRCYMPVLPYFLFAIFCLFAYAAVIRKN